MRFSFVSIVFFDPRYEVPCGIPYCVGAMFLDSVTGSYIFLDLFNFEQLTLELLKLPMLTSPVWAYYTNIDRAFIYFRCKTSDFDSGLEKFMVDKYDSMVYIHRNREQSKYRRLRSMLISGTNFSDKLGPIY